MTATQIEICHISEIPLSEGRECLVDGELIAIFRPRNGVLYAVQARCPHKQGPLADGLVGSTTVICPFHSWKFNIETGQGPEEGCKLKTYPVEVKDNGFIVLTLSE